MLRERAAIFRSHRRPSPDKRGAPTGAALLKATLVAAVLLSVAAGEQPAFGQAGVTRSQGSRVTGAIQGQIRQAVRPRLQIKNPAGPVTSLGMSADGRVLAIVHDNNSVRIWDLQNGVEQARYPTADPPRAIRVSDDGARVVIGTEGGKVIVLNAATGLPLATFSNHRGAVTAIAISPDHTNVVSAGADGTLRLWDGRVGRQAAVLEGQAGVTSVALAGDNRRVVAGGPAGRVIIWNAGTDAAPTPLSSASPGIVSVGFNTAGQIVAVGSDGAAYTWDANSPAAPARSFKAVSQARSAQLSGDGRTAAVSDSDSRTEVVDMQSGRVLRQFSTTPGSSRFVLVDINQKRLVMGGNDGIVRILNVNSGVPLAQIISTLNGWAALDEQGRFDGTPAGVQDVQWLAAQLNLPIDNFSSNYFEPGLVGKYMRDQPGLVAPAPGQQVSTGIFLPPRVTVTAQPGPYNGGAEIQVTVQAEDLGVGIGTVRLYQNGKLVPTERQTGEQRGANTLTRSYRVALVAGSNRLEGIGTNPQQIDGEPGRLDLTATGQVALPNLNIVTIGINRYRDAKYNLDYGVPDALAILKRLDQGSSGAFNKVVGYQLTDESATRSGIISALGALQQLSADDVLVVYVAGHGEIVGDEWYLLPQDVTFTPEGIKSGGISASMLRDLLAKARPQRVLVLIDSCKSGGGVDTLATSLDRRVLRSVGRETGVAMLAGARRDQSAAEFPKLGHGAFTFVVLEGLAGKADTTKAGKITASGLISYSTSALPSLTKSLANFIQVPVAYARGDDFQVAK